MPISKLQDEGFHDTDIGDLARGGFHTIEALAHALSQDLLHLQSEDLSIGMIKMMRKAAWKLAPVKISAAASAVQQDIETDIVISTGCRPLDDILQGGIQTGCLTEVFGGFRCGKTQLALTLCVVCQLPVEMGGAEGKALYVDTEGTFHPGRIVQMADMYNLDVDAVLDNVSVAQVFNSKQQAEVLAGARALLVESRFALIVVDSVTALFRIEFPGLEELRQQHVAHFLRSLQCLVDEFGVAMVITHQVPVDLDSSTCSLPDITSAGGNIMADASMTRLWLRKERGGTRIAKIVSSSWLPELEAEFAIGPEGVCDAKD